MPASRLRFFKRCWEYLRLTERRKLPNQLRGIYVLFDNPTTTPEVFNVVYVGLAGLSERSSIRRRLRTHTKRKKGKWTHFSVFEVHDNITADEIREFEGLLRHIYRDDAGVNPLNRSRGFDGFRAADVRVAHKGKWRRSA